MSTSGGGGCWPDDIMFTMPSGNIATCICNCCCRTSAAVCFRLPVDKEYLSLEKRQIRFK